jgi:ubiquitin-like-conjugating enzyme ATG3
MASDDNDYEIVEKTIVDDKLSEKSAASGSSLRTWLTQKVILTLDKYNGTTTKSTINKTGKLTPDEFVKAGDYLVDNFPSWKWSKGLSRKKRDCLPANKQYLVTRKMNCIPTIIDNNDWDDFSKLNLEENIPEDTTLITEINKLVDNVDVVDDVDDVDNIDDIDDYDYSSVVVDDDNDICDEPNCISTRTYDIYMTYDSYYLTPRVWLYGYNENNEPLKGAEWQNDFSAEHVNKTVTYESHPHEMFSCPTIHPCNHASAMLSIINMTKDDDKLEIDVRLYLLIFLKFIQTIIPNIDCDFTGELDITHMKK